METAYEATFIVDTTLAEEQVTGVVDKYTGVITRSGGRIEDIDRMEPRRLAYEIKGRREGLYVVVNFTSEPAAKDELDRIFRISDDTLRFMIVKQDKRADRFPSRTRAAEYERREREQAARAAAYPPAAPAGVQPVTDLSAAPTGVGVENANGVSDNTENATSLPPAEDGTLEAAQPEAEQELTSTDAQPEAEQAAAEQETAGA
jgi:small subunit ribosomal protein S6